jgi:hypothetical protein
MHEMYEEWKQNTKRWKSSSIYSNDSNTDPLYDENPQAMEKYNCTGIC